MYQPTEFLDGENIVIIGRVPHYRYTGTTYKDKLKNGLSLDYVFSQEDMTPIYNDEVIVKTESNKYRENSEFVNYEENCCFYENKEMELTRTTRKGKWRQFKKKQSRNVKKNYIRQNGYAYKLFIIDQQLPFELDDPYAYDSDDDYDDEMHVCYCYKCNN